MGEDSSRYQPLQVKEFKSSIPQHILAKLSDGERYMVETMSKLENQGDWLIETIQVQHSALRELDLRQTGTEKWKSEAEHRIVTVEKTSTDSSVLAEKVWDWKNLMTGRWAILFWLATILIPVALKFLLDVWLKRP